MSQISRRDFVKKTSLGALGAGLLMSGVKHLMLPQKLFAKIKLPRVGSNIGPLEKQVSM